MSSSTVAHLGHARTEVVARGRVTAILPQPQPRGEGENICSQLL